nr:hypothetical protein [Azotobacter chroococcum]
MAVIVGQAQGRGGTAGRQDRARPDGLALLPVGGEGGEAFALVLHQALADLGFDAGGIHTEQPAVEVVEGEAGGFLFAAGGRGGHDDHAFLENLIALNTAVLRLPVEADGFADGLHGDKAFAGWSGNYGQSLAMEIDCSELEVGVRHGEFPVLACLPRPSAKMGERNRAGWRTGNGNRRAVRPPHTARP